MSIGINETYKKDNVIVDIISCQRCGDNHNRLVFMRLDNPRDEYNFWAMCPVKNQPLTMRVVSKELIDATEGV